jgi:hypothetical protein
LHTIRKQNINNVNTFYPECNVQYYTFNLLQIKVVS